MNLHGRPGESVNYIAPAAEGPEQETAGEPGLPAKLRELMAKGAAWAAALVSAVLGGERDENRLTNVVFHTRHPERSGRGIEKAETAAAREWLAYRNEIVRPLLKTLVPGNTATPVAAGDGDECSRKGDVPQGRFATLVVTRPGIEYRYQIAADDVLWTARMMQGEAGGRANDDNFAVVWAMLNRWALLTNPQRLKGSRWRSFADFIRNYSTPLQPMLKYGSAKHHYTSPGYVKLGGNYPGTNVPRGQLKRHLELQMTCWSALKPEARKAAEAVMKGEIPNPVGLATEFANTATYYSRQHGGQRPTRDEWREYTKTFGLSKRFTKNEHGKNIRTADKDGWIWIGDRANLDQYGQNTFFLRSRPVAGDSARTPIAQLPDGTVQLVKP